MNRFSNVIFGQKVFIINQKQELLIIKRKHVEIYQSLWDIPGGKLQDDETLKEALTRELQEEVGLQLNTIIIILSSAKFIGSMPDHPILFRNFYLCATTGNVALSPEHSEYKWIKVNELKNFQFPEDQDFQETLQQLPQIIQKIQLDISYSHI
jgi:8-oxo-dGTP diphosphatase